MKKEGKYNKKTKSGETDQKFKSGELRDIILRVLGVSILIGGTVAVSPNFPIFFGAILKMIEEIKGYKVPEKKVKRVLANLEKKEILHIEADDDKAIVYIKDRFNPVIITYSLQSLMDFKKKEKKWNGRWFLVFFDVPESQRNKRNYLRKFLTKLGFYPYQKSVYIFPYECEQEINLIKKIVEGAKYMKYIVANKIEDEERIKTFFKL